ncbi:MAG: hypothetical protein IH891_01265 [Planctomycetes bacterium]|nr:hypothetical protein [Planctomycetota bacterium]
MNPPEDMVNFRRRNVHPANAIPSNTVRRRFLSVWYRCCHTYGRLYRNRQETRYEGRCPRCGVKVQAGIGSQGTKRRTFEAR